MASALPSIVSEYLFVCLYVLLSVCFSVCLCICPTVHLFSFVRLLISQVVCHFICPSTSQSICMSVKLSKACLFWQFFHLSICKPICFFYSSACLYLFSVPFFFSIHLLVHLLYQLSMILQISKIIVKCCLVYFFSKNRLSR